MSNSLVSDTFPVKGMSCAACAGSVESILKHTIGVEDAEVNFAAHTVKVTYQSNLKSQLLKDALLEVGYDLDLEAKAHQESIKKEKALAYQKLKRDTLYSAIFTLPVFVIGMFFPHWSYGPYISALLSAPVLFIWGRQFYIRAFKQIKRGIAGMDALVALSTGISYSFSLFSTLYPRFWTQYGMESHVYYEAAVVIMVFVSLGKVLEERAKGQTSLALEKLLGLQSPIVYRLREGKEEEIGIDEVLISDILRVKAGQSIPVDGEIVEGEALVNESMLSGEALALAKRPGDKVYAGTILEKGSLAIRTEKLADSTLLAQIIRRVGEAQGSKAPVQELVNRIAGIFVPTVLVISIITFASWILFAGIEAFPQALYTSIAVLVIACPCALGLATPTAIMVGIGKGAENNILIRDARSLEETQSIDTLVLDKTGTITQGRPQILEQDWRQDFQTDFHQQVLLSMQLFSSHPLATAFVRMLRESGTQELKLQAYQEVQGRGVKITDHHGMVYGCGNAAYLNDFGLEETSIHQAKANAAQAQGKTVLYFFTKEELIAQFILGDALKEGSREAIKDLQDRGLDLILLSGDQENTTAYWAQELGINKYRAEVLPQDKGQLVRDLQARGKRVAMIGDGINDSEALAQAELGIAMGHGSDIAIEAGSITLMSSDLRLIPKAFKLSRITLAGIRQNLFWAFIYNLIGIPIAAGLLYPINGFLLDPMIAGAAMALSSVSVVSNSLRLRRKSL